MTLAIVLGTAQDGGSPQLGGPPAPTRLVASVAIVAEAGSTLLLDATPDIKAQLARLSSHPSQAGRRYRNPVDHVALTHAHMGHYLGLAHFGIEANNASRVGCWVTARMRDFLASNQPWRALIENHNLEVNVVEPGVATSIEDGLAIELVPVPHRDELSDTVAISVNDRLLYLPDIDSWEQWPHAADVIARHRVAMLDGCFFSAGELPGRDVATIPHPFVPDTLDRFAHLAGTTRILLTHVNHTNPIANPDSDERLQVEAAGFEVAFEGMEIDLDD